MSAEEKPQPEPRSGDEALTQAQREMLPSGAPGWMAFFRFVVKLYAEAHAHGGRAYLEWAEWNQFFKAAIRFGCVARDEITGELIPLETYSAMFPRANKHLGSLLHAALIETFRQVREAKQRGDSAWHFSRWQHDRCVTYDCEMAERERATAERRQSSTSVSSITDRKSRRRRDVDDDGDE